MRERRAAAHRSRKPYSAAARAARFGVPSFKLTGRAAKPEEDTVLLSSLGFGCKQRVAEKARKARGTGQSAARQTFEEQTPMHLVLIGAALPRRREAVLIHDRLGSREKLRAG